MKTTVLLLTLSLVTFAYSQEQATTIGLKGGLNIGFLNGQDSDIENTDTEVRLGLNAGAYGEIALHPIFTLQPEVVYTQKGETVEAGGDVLGGTWNIELSYLEIPVLAKVYFPVETATRPFVYAGPFLGFNLSAESDDIYQFAGFDFTGESNLEDEVNTTEVGVVAGAGVSYLLEKIVLMLDIRYTQGLTRTFDDDTFDEVFTGTVAAQLGVGLRVGDY